MIVKLQLNQLVTMLFITILKIHFYHLKKLLVLIFLEGIEEIGSEAFYKCDDLTNKTIKLPSSIQHVGDKVFSETNLEVLDLSDLISTFFILTN